MQMAGLPSPAVRSLCDVRRRWNLTPDGPPFATRSSLLQAVRTRDGRPAMLKLARLPEEARGVGVLLAWAGHGTAPILRHDGPILLMPRAAGDLVAVHRRGAGDVALDRIADVARELHAGEVAPELLVPLERWFAALRRIAERHGGTWSLAWSRAQELLASTEVRVPLHGDLHHANVLNFGTPKAPDWRAIDPKGLYGDAAFDGVAALLNPDRSSLGGDPAEMRARATRLAAGAGLDPERVLAWTEAFSALSAAWAIEDRTSPAADLAWRRTARRALDDPATAPAGPRPPA